MSKIQKSFTLGEVAKVLGVDQGEVIKHLNKCAPGFSQRDPKHLSQSELDCIKKAIESQGQ